MTGGLQQTDFRFFAGCLAWEPGQLQREIAAGAWHTAACSRSLVLKQCLQVGGCRGNGMQVRCCALLCWTGGGPMAASWYSNLHRHSSCTMPSLPLPFSRLLLLQLPVPLWRETMCLMGGRYAEEARQQQAADGDSDDD